MIGLFIVNFTDFIFVKGYVLARIADLITFCEGELRNYNTKAK